MKLPLPTEKYEIHRMRMPVRWGDMDAFGHVNNTVYFRYFEQARVEWLTQGGRTMVADGKGPVGVNAFCNFYRQLEYPANLVITQYLSHPGRSSCDVWMTIERADQPGQIVADGGATIVWVDFAASRAVPLPPWVRALMDEGIARARERMAMQQQIQQQVQGSDPLPVQPD